MIILTAGQSSEILLQNEDFLKILKINGLASVETLSGYEVGFFKKVLKTSELPTIFGPYLEVTKIKITCLTGTLSYESNFVFEEPVPSVLIPLTSSLQCIGGKALTFTRASVAWDVDDNGIYRQRAVNAPDINSDGVLIEPQVTNLCTNFNAAPAIDASVVASSGAVTVINDLTLLAKSGIANLVPSGDLYQYINSTGSTQTVTIGGTVGATTLACVSAFCRSFGVNQASLGLTGQGNVLIPNSDKLVRVSSESIVHSLAGDQLQFSVPAGTTIQFILNQLTGVIGFEAPLTSPIVTAGATAIRSATLLSMPIVNNDTIPSNNFTIYAELTPGTDKQDSESSSGFCPFGIYQASPLNRIVPRGVVVTKSVAGVDYGNHRIGVMPCKGVTHKFVLRQSSTDGLYCSFDGFGSFAVDTSAGNDVAGLTITSGTFLIGIDNPSNTSRQFIGRIKNIKIFYKDLSKTDCDILSGKPSFDSFPLIGPAIQDTRKKNRLWALSKKSATSPYSEIIYSDDYFNSINFYFQLPSPTIFVTLHQDSKGNLYFSSPGGSSVNRLDVVTGTVAAVITFFPTSSTWSWTQWHWGLDNSGNIYTCAYSVTSNTQHRYIWKSLDNGVTFTRYDAVAVQYPTINPALNSHIHSLHVNPYTNKLVLTFGDVERGIIISKASTGDLLPNGVFATDWDVVTEASIVGPVGFTFLSDTVLFATDNPGNSNYIKNLSGLVASFCYKFKAPIAVISPYFIRAVNDLEVWGASYNESNVTTSVSCLWQLKRDYIGAQWYLAKAIQVEDGRITGSDFYEICSNNFGNAIDSPFLFFCIKEHNSSGTRTLARLSR